MRHLQFPHERGHDLGLVDTQLQISAQARAERNVRPRELLPLAGERFLLVGSSRAWISSVTDQTLEELKLPLSIGGGLVWTSGPRAGQPVFFNNQAATIVLAATAPPDAGARPCRLIAAYLTHRLERLSRPRDRSLTDWELRGGFLSDGCRKSVGQGHDDGIGNALIAEVTHPPPSSGNDRRFTLALASLAAVRVPWARGPLQIALDTGRGGEAVRADALVAFSEVGGDPAAIALYLARWADRKEGFDGNLDMAISIAFYRSPRIRAQGAPLLAAAYRDKRRGFDSVRTLLCEFPATPAPDVLRLCSQSVRYAEDRWQQSRTRRDLLLRFGLTSVLAGGAAAGAWATSSNDAGRALATGSATAAGYSIGYTAWVTTPNGGGAITGLTDSFEVVVGVITGLVGGTVGLLATDEPGTSRRVVAVSSATLTIVLAVARLVHDWR